MKDNRKRNFWREKTEQNTGENYIRNATHVRQGHVCLFAVVVVLSLVFQKTEKYNVINVEVNVSTIERTVDTWPIAVSK